MAREVDEGEIAYVDAIPLDRFHRPVVPLSAQYRIQCLTTGQEVLKWTPIPNAGVANEILITADQNAILNQRNRVERKQMTVEAIDPDGPKRALIEWNVNNISGV